MNKAQRWFSRDCLTLEQSSALVRSEQKKRKGEVIHRWRDVTSQGRFKAAPLTQAYSAGVRRRVRSAALTNPPKACRLWNPRQETASLTTRAEGLATLLDPAQGRAVLTIPARGNVPSAPCAKDVPPSPPCPKVAALEPASGTGVP